MTVLLVLILATATPPTLRPEIVPQNPLGWSNRKLVSSSNQQRVAVVTATSSALAVYDVQARALFGVFNVPFAFREAVFAASDQQVWMVTNMGEPTMIDLASGKSQNLKRTDSMHNLAASPDGSNVVYVATKSLVRYTTAAAFSPKATAPFAGGAAAAVFSPDGKRLITVGAELREHDPLTLAGRGEAVAVGLHGTEALYFTPQGQLLVCGLKHALIDLGTKKVLWSQPGIKESRCAYDPGRQRLFVSTTTEYAVATLDALTGKEIEKKSYPSSINGLLVVSEGRDLLVLTGSGGIWVESLESGTRTATLAPVGEVSGFVMTARDPAQVTWLNQGRLLALDLRTGRARELDVKHHSLLLGDGRHMLVPRGEANMIVDLDTGQDKVKLPAGYYSAVDSEKYILMQADEGRRKTVVLEKATAKVAYTVDTPPKTLPVNCRIAAQHFLVCNYDHSQGSVVALVDLDLGKEVWRGPESLRVNSLSLDVSPDGSRIAMKTLAPKTGLILHDWQRNSSSEVAPGSERLVPMSVAFSPSGKWLALSALHERSVYIYDGATGSAVAVLGGLTRTPERVTFSADEKFVVASVETENAIVVWSTSDWQHKLRHINRGDGQWLSMTPEGYYVAAPGAARLVKFRVGLALFAFELFDLRLNRPDRVAATLALATASEIDVYRRAYEKRLARLGIAEKDLGDDFHTPSVRLVSRRIESGVAKVTVRVADAQVALARLLVVVDGVPIGARNGIAIAGKKKTAEVSFSVPVVPGPQTIRVSALNVRGAESPAIELVETGSGAPKSALYVFAIGVARYQQPDFNLEYSAKDAADFAQALNGDVLKKRYERIETTVLTDEQVTREAVMQLKTRLKALSPSDAVIVFVAGHGLLDDKLDYFFATHDVDFAHPAGRGLDYRDLEDLLDDIPPRRRLLVMDTCHSGEVDRDEMQLAAAAVEKMPGLKLRGLKSVKKATPALGTRLASELTAELFKDFKVGNGASILSSAGGAEFALELGALKNGVFSATFIKGLGNTALADDDRSGAVSFEELVRYVGREVPRITSGNQRPQLRQHNGQSPIF